MRTIIIVERRDAVRDGLIGIPLGELEIFDLALDLNVIQEANVLIVTDKEHEPPSFRAMKDRWTGTDQIYPLNQICHFIQVRVLANSSSETIM